MTDVSVLEERIDALTRLSNQRFQDSEKAVAAALAAAEKAVEAALTAAEKAVAKAEVAQQRVNETQNEFRGTLKDQAADLMPRAETEILVRELRASIAGIAGTRREGAAESKTEGRAQVSNATTIMTALIAVVFVSLALYAALRSPSPSAPATTVTVTVPAP